MNPQTPDYASMTLEELEAGWRSRPLEIGLHHALFQRRHEIGDELAALAHMIAVKAIEAHDTPDAHQSAWNMYMVATGYFMKGDYAIAEQWYRLVLLLDPGIAEVYQNMVVVHEHFGRHALAEQSRATAYRMQRVFIDPILNQKRQLLILSVGRTKGNIPFDVLLSSDNSRRIRYVIDYASDAEDQQLPPYDLVFNVIAEPDAAEFVHERVLRFLAHNSKPLINHPDKVLRTRRHLMPELLGTLPGVAVAGCCRIAAGTDDVQSRMEQSAVQFPVLARPNASQGGEGVVLCSDLPQLQDWLRQRHDASYLCSFVNFQSPDGYWRKYRIIFVDREPYPYHLAIGPHWMVHYYTAEMLAHPWKIAEELRFLQDPGGVLGEPAMQALRQIGQALELEYAGVDFTLLPDGQLLVFEANASMLVHRVSMDGKIAHKNAYVERIADAFERMQQRLEQII